MRDKYDDDDIICPACKSDDIEENSPNDQVYGIGLYAMYDFIGGINKVFNKYRCLKCRYEWQ